MVLACIDVRLNLLASLTDRLDEVAPLRIAEDLCEVSCGPVRLAVLADTGDPIWTISVTSTKWS